MKTRMERLAEAVTVLAEAYRQKITPITIRAYDLGTSDIDIELVEAAVCQAIIQCKFLPTVSELREIIGIRTGILSVNERIVIAWTAIKRAVSQIGGYGSVSFDCPIINAVIRAMGGWSRFTECEAGQSFDVWLRKEFEANYAAFLKNGIEARQTLPLAGIVDKTNSATGHIDRCQIVTVKTGLPAPPAKLIRCSTSNALQAPETKRIANKVALQLNLPPDELASQQNAVLSKEELHRSKDAAINRLMEVNAKRQPGEQPT